MMNHNIYQMLSYHLTTSLVYLIYFYQLALRFKVTRPSFFGGVPSYFEALWYSHLYFYRKSNT